MISRVWTPLGDDAAARELLHSLLKGEMHRNVSAVTVEASCQMEEARVKLSAIHNNNVIIKLIRIFALKHIS